MNAMTELPVEYEDSFRLVVEIIKHYSRTVTLQLLNLIKYSGRFLFAETGIRIVNTSHLIDTDTNSRNLTHSLTMNAHTNSCHCHYHTQAQASSLLFFPNTDQITLCPMITQTTLFAAGWLVLSLSLQYTFLIKNLCFCHSSQF